MRKFVSGDICRRSVMDSYMDGDVGEPRTTCRGGEQFCDVCRGQGTKRVRVVVVEGEDGRSTKRVRRETRFQDEEEQRSVEEARRAGERQRAEADRSREETEKMAEEGRRIEFEQRQRRFQAIEYRQRDERMQHGEITNKMERHLMEWKHGCSICRVRGRADDRRHNWRQCEQGETDRTTIGVVKDALIKVRWGNGRLCCRQCWAPQAVCQSFERIDDSGRARFREKAGIPACQFRGVLFEAAAVILAVGREAVMDWMTQEAERAGVSSRPNEDVWTDVCMKWLGCSVVRGGTEMSGMCWMFYNWASFVQHEA